MTPKVPTVKEQWQYAQQLQGDLRAKLGAKDPLFEEIENLIHELRIASESTIFQDFEYAAENRVEDTLWSAHSLINARYRKICARFKEDELKKLHVERRKWEKRYVDFLKTSQYFYKGYIQRLNSHFDSIPELIVITHRLSLESKTVETRVKVREETQHKILMSCHATLLRLGDLCRYRNVIRTKDRSWDQAMAYYNLANDLYPNSGSAYSQMAIISLLDNDHLHAVYQLYRALAVKEPYELARRNIETEFKKIIAEWEGFDKKLPRAPKSVSRGNSSTAPLVLWFVRLHAKLYKGEEFADHDELENEVLSQMNVLLKEQPLEGILDIFVLVNIAAEYFAGERVRADHSAESLQSYYFFIRLNVRMMFMLLQLFQPELDIDDNNIPDVTSHKRKCQSETITAVTRRILPALRQYSTWLVMRAPVLVAQVGTASLNVHIREMWSIYCSTLTLLGLVFPPANLPVIEYLLEEDALTVGFKPFRDSDMCDIYTDEDGKLRPRDTDPNIPRSHPNVEMQARVRGILRDGVMLSQDDRFPIQLVDGAFCFVEEGLPLSSPSNGQSSANVHTSYNESPPKMELNIRQPEAVLENGLSRTPSVAPSDSHQSMSTDMYRMVDDLLTPSTGRRTENSGITNDTSYGMHSGTANEIFVPMLQDNRPSSRQGPPAHYPSLSASSIWSSPFTPQPGELNSNSGHPTTASRLSTLRLGGIQQLQQFATIETPEKTVGYTPRNAWGTGISQSSSRPRSRQDAGRHDVGLQLQQSLAEQYGSSGFSDPSSLYQNTPSFGGRNLRHPNGGFGNSTTYNASTNYAGASDFDQAIMLQSSIWNGSHHATGGFGPTPPGGQGG